MTTTLYPLSNTADVHLGTDNLNLQGTATGWFPRLLAYYRGIGNSISNSVPTVNGPVSGIEATTTVSITNPLEWISFPVDRDVTIAGTITCNVWAAESSASANCAVNVVIDVIRANATGTRNSNTIVEIGRSTNTTEMALTTRAVNSFTITPTSTVVNRGDRLRMRIYADDSAAATMATGFTFNVGFNGLTSGSDGDSFVTFTEDFDFEWPAGSDVIDQWVGTSQGFTYSIGRTSSERVAQSFVAPAGSSIINTVKAGVAKFGAPTDNFIIEIQTDSAGLPSGTVVGTVVTLAGTGMSTGLTMVTWSGLSISVTPGNTYWLVFRRDGALSSSANYTIYSSNGTPAGYAVAKAFTAAAWVDQARPAVFYVGFTIPSTTLYLTDTVSDVATAADDKEVWTGRGSGVNSLLTNTAAGWTAPIQFDNGPVVDWYTKPLAAFTLGGQITVNVRAAETSAAANATVRCEVARVDSDGSNPTVWANWCIAPLNTSDGGELGTTEAVRTVNCTGDALAISDGQRLRFRFFLDDIASAAMGGSNTSNLYYNGTSGGASGDTYVVIPAVVTLGPTAYTESATVLIDIQASGTEIATFADAATPSVDISTTGTELRELTDAQTVVVDISTSGTELREVTDAATVLVDITVTGTDVYVPPPQANPPFLTRPYIVGGQAYQDRSRW